MIAQELALSEQPVKNNSPGSSRNPASPSASNSFFTYAITEISARLNGFPE